MDKDNGNNDRLITTIVFALCALVIVTCALLFSTSQLTYKSNVPDKAIVATTYQSSDDVVIADPTVQKIQALEQNNQELRYQRDIADIHADLIDRQNSWFEILIAAFGILITAIVIYFSFNFSKSAVAEAKNSVRVDFEKMQAEFDRELAIVKGKTKEVTLHADTAQKLLNGLSAGEVPKDKATRKTLRQIAKEAQNKPIREQTIDDYRALISVSNIDKDWVSMERHAYMMFALFEKDADDEGIGFALFTRAFALNELKKSDDAIAVYDALIERFDDSDNPVLQELLARAMFNKAVSLGEMERTEIAIVVYDELIERFEDSDDPALQELLARAMFNKAVSLGEMERTEDAIVVYDELIERFEDSDDPAIKEVLSGSMYNKGSRLTVLQRMGDAVDVFAALIKRFEDGDAPSIQKIVAQAMNFRGICLDALERYEDAIASYDALTKRFKDSDDLVLQGQVAKAANGKGLCLFALGRTDEEIACYDMLIERFEDSDDPAIQEQLAQAINSKGLCLHGLERYEDAISIYDALINQFKDNDVPTLQEQVAKAMYNKARIYARNNKVSKAIASLKDWRDNSVLFDCRKIIEDYVFDNVRDKVSFKKFMRDSGCEE